MLCEIDFKVWQSKQDQNAIDDSPEERLETNKLFQIPKADQPVVDSAG